jgi:hypothetical protein
MADHPKSLRKFATLSLAPVLAALALSACVQDFARNGGPEEGIGYRDARYVEIEAMRDYRQCRDDALVLDRQARQAGSAARYLASARQLETCEANLGPEAASLAPDERMRAYALSVQNYLKGGDVAHARANLETFQTAFPDHDLYYPDGSSFTETMEILLGLRDRSAVGEFSVANVGETLKAELRRARYWQRN